MLILIVVPASILLSTEFLIKNYKQGAPIIVEGKRVWKEYKELEFREELFQEVGQAFEAEHNMKVGKVGSANCRLFHLQKQWILLRNGLLIMIVKI